MQPDKFQPLRPDDVGIHPALRASDRPGVFGKGEVSDLNAFVADLFDRLTGIGEPPLFVNLVADSVAKTERHESLVYGGRQQGLNWHKEFAGGRSSQPCK